MNKITSYILAALACIVLFFLYALIGGFLRWENAGGIIPMTILVIAMGATWKGITGLSKDKTPKDNEVEVEVENETNNAS